MVEPGGAGTLSQWHSSCMLSGHVKTRTHSNPPCQSHWSRHLPCEVTPTRSNVRTRLWSDVDYPWSGLAVCGCWNMASSSQWERVSLGWRSFIHRHQYKGTYHGTNWCSWVPPQERKKHQPVFSESSDDYAALIWQKEASDKSDISRKWAKCVCHLHWRQWNIMMSYLTYLLVGWVFLHEIWPGRRAHYVNYENINNSNLDGMSLASFCQSRAV